MQRFAIKRSCALLLGGGVVRGDVSNPTAARARCRRLVNTKCPRGRSKKREAGAPLRRRCRGILAVTALGKPEFWAAQRGKSALHSLSTWSLLSQALDDQRGTSWMRVVPSRFVTTDWPCATECVHSKIQPTSPRPWGFKPNLPSKDYCKATPSCRPEGGPASDSLPTTARCATPAYQHRLKHNN